MEPLKPASNSQPGFGIISDVEVFDAEDKRISQQRILPSAVKARQLGDIISSQPVTDQLGTGLVNRTVIRGVPPQSASFVFTVNDPDNRVLIAVPDIAFYIGSLAPANRWPTSSFGMGTMPTSVFNSWADTNNHNSAVRATIRNVTGDDQLVYCVCRFRIIANPSPTASTSGQIADSSVILGSGGGP